jgi:formylglycine-generating enzyme required for sulfatase activity/tRNA A-37 threonylcarbamoyl transferase component Bud32
MNPTKQIKQKINDLEDREKLLSQKINRIRKEHAIAVDPSFKFKLEQDLKIAEEDQDKIQEEIGKLLQQIETHIAEIKGENFLSVPFNLWDIYEEIKFIGAGGIAEVYKVKNKRTHNISALKVLKFKHHKDYEIIARFWAEGRILGVLAGTGKHHIVKIRNLGKSADDEYFIEMEFIEGKTLAQHLMEKKTLTIQEVREILIQLCSALKRTHEFDVIHRDLKPQNIIIGKNNSLTLMDFGIAKRLDSKSIVTQKFIGTCAYSAPEMFSKKRFGKISQRTDIYSFGVLIYQLLTGKLPFGDTTTEAIHGHCYEAFPKINEENIPPRVKQLIAKCTQKTQKDRYQSIDELEEIIQQPKTWELPDEKKPDPPPPPTRNFPKTKILMALAFIVMVIMSVSLVWYFNGRTPDNHENGKLQAIVDSTYIEKPSEDTQKITEQPGTVSITSTPEGAEIYIDDVFKGVTPQTIDLAKGTYTVRLEIDGYEIYKKENITIEKDRDTPLDFKLEPIPVISNTNCPTTKGIEFVSVKGGTFQMGDQFNEGYSDETPVHTVTVDDFCMSKYEITFAQYDAFCEATGRTKPDDEGWGRGNRPVINVSWEDATAFCEWAGGRLPTEAEWEYAARSGGKKEKYAGFSDESLIYQYANFCDVNCSKSWKDENQDDGYQYTAPVGSYKPNGLGLYDMSGNVWEWCADWYDSDYYDRKVKDNPEGPETGEYKVVRGGSWYATPYNLRSTDRYYYTPSSGYTYIGFRVVVSRAQ